ncbi:MAG: DUF2796 domain-containing protein [Neomegalonema sp.]|nr:DUF2796 domain-containing protein [Neomegalonema sp.]
MNKPFLPFPAIALSLMAGVMALPALAEQHGEMRGLGAHEHGHAQLNIALDGPMVSMELIAPGADIVGFEHDASSDADKAAIEQAKAVLADPVSVFGLPEAAQCLVQSAHVELETEGAEGHDDHDAHDDHDHEKHEHEEHDHEEHAHEAHEHEHEEHEHEEHAHDEHHEQAHGQHSEFHAEYALTCANPAALTALELRFFDLFPHAEEVEATILSTKGQFRAELTRAAPRLDLGDVL